MLPCQRYALDIVSSTNHASYTLQDAQGERFVLDLESIDWETMTNWVDASADLPLYRQRPLEDFWFTWLAEQQVVYVCFRHYDAFAENARNLLQWMEQMPAARLILDLRQNGGGDLTKVRRHLLPALKAHPQINQPGHLFVIIGHQTYSAAMSNATDFRKETHAILVGEPTSARPNGYQETYGFTLPNSQLRASCSTRFYRFQAEATPAVMPDKLIEPTWEAYRAGRDPVMAWILR